MTAPESREATALDGALAGKRVIVCMGAGGVGKTTTSAALALGLAARGAKVAVVTIDPARRLAAALGLEQLPSEPTRIAPALLASQGVEVEGELWALMLDAKRTFDAIVTSFAADERARKEILSNHVYHEISTAVAGSHELSAISKLYELHDEHDFDAIVLDTPPSRNALDFLSAPTRMLRFMEGRALQVFLAPGGITARMFGRGTALLFAVFARVTGVDLLSDLSTFFRSLGGVLDGFGERTRGVQELLRDERTTFVIVTSPESEPAREASHLARTLAEGGMRAGAVIVNRVNRTGLEGVTRERAAEILGGSLDPALAGRLAHNLSDFDVLARRDAHTVAELREALGVPLAEVPYLDEDVEDLRRLGVIAGHLLA